jgi:hypothetical protein
LKSLYGSGVIDYKKNRLIEEIRFADNDELEIFCLLPSQIASIGSNIDIFHNAHSFVEMPKNVIQNYADNIQNILSKDNSVVSLVSYDGYDVNTTLDPNLLPNFFKKTAKKYLIETLTPARSNFHFIIE